MQELDTSDECPLEFTEILGENRISDDVRRAYIWACIKFFSTEELNLEELVDPDIFSDADKKLAKAVSITGPLEDREDAEREATAKLGVVCAPLHMWTVFEKPLWIVCLAN